MSGTVVRTVGIKGSGDKDGDSFSAIVNLALEGYVCCLPFTMELHFFTEETWSSLAM